MHHKEIIKEVRIRIWVPRLQVNLSRGKRYWLCNCLLCEKEQLINEKKLLLGNPHLCSCINDLPGKRFGKWTIIERDERAERSGYWIAECDCGFRSSVRQDHLIYRRSRSCGCEVQKIRRLKRKLNKVVLCKDRAIVYLGEHKAMIDLEDVDKIKDHYWSLQNGYARTYISENHLVFMQKMIMNTDARVYRKNSNRLDNRKKNLTIKSQTYKKQKAKHNAMRSRKSLGELISLYGTSAGLYFP
jgi:hypothetical protein